jgi:hypothetical protein
MHEFDPPIAGNGLLPVLEHYQGDGEKPAGTLVKFEAWVAGFVDEHEHRRRVYAPLPCPQQGLSAPWPDSQPT